MFRKLLTVAFLLGTQAVFSAPNSAQKKMLETLSFIEGTFESMYAPKAWKYTHAGWTLEGAMERAKKGVLAKENIKVVEFHQLLKDFFASTMDYHVGFSLNRTESAKLPLTVREAEGRFFIVHIDREKLSESSFPFHVGDEVVSFDGLPTSDAVKKVQAQFAENVAITDYALAQLDLTYRRASRGHQVPKGAVILQLRKKGTDKIRSIQLAWDYTPEKVDYSPVENTDRNTFRSLGEKMISDLRSHSYHSPLAKAYKSKKTKREDPFGIGNKVSFLPKLGEVLWKSSSVYFDSYIYKDEKGRSIGYLRIPHFGMGNWEFPELVTIVKKLSEETDALVLDQLNNPGGSLFFMYALGSLLTDNVLDTPRESFTIDPYTVQSAFDYIEALNLVDTEEKVIQFFRTNNIDGYPLNLNFVNFMKQYYHFVIDQWRQGKLLTDQFYVFGADKVNPHPKVNYTQPIVLLINELDFSCGDFFPAIMKDNKRVKLHGVRTAGAGGYVLSTYNYNLVGLDYFSFTGSHALRPNGLPIENLGVTPDVPYSPTARDYTENFVDYVKSINATVDEML